MFSVDVFYGNLNLPVRENLDPFIWQLLALVGIQQSGFYYTLQLIIVFLGLISLFSTLELSAKNIIFSAVLCLALVLTFSGTNVFLLKIHWMPWVMTFLLKTRITGKLTSTLGLVVVLWLFVLASGALAPTGIIFIALGYLLLISQELEVNPDKVGLRVNSFLLICSYVLSTYIMPIYAMPDYPGDARLTTVSPLTFRELPMVGYYLFPTPVLWEGYRDLIFRDVSLYSLIFIFTCLIVYGPTRNKHLLLNQYFIGQIALVIIVCLESVVNAQFVNSTPYYAMRRIIPGLALQEMPSTLLLLGSSALFPALLLRWQCVLNFTLLMPALLVMVMSFSLPQFTSLKNANYYFSDQFFSGRYPLAATSNYVVSRLGGWLLKSGINKERAVENLNKLKAGIDYKVIVTSSVNQEQTINLLDGDMKTIWRTGRRQQAGDNIILEFNSPLNIVKTVLENKGAEQDFPRGLKVSASNDGVSYETILEQADWQGGLKWTDSGLPYFTNQANVSVDLPTQEKVKNLRFEQIGSSDRFDWTVADISLYALK
ncbi:MAG: discoidin domain-containing protein [Deltaproteobacteria bacterium]|nr:discoidin domain-containing protein [Deltaproteobacteria bacterium]